MTSKRSALAVAVVDAYSSGSLLPGALAKRGFQTIHVQTQASVPEHLVSSHHPEDHAHTIIFDGDLEACARRVADHRPVAVMAGTETGVPLADYLSEWLGLPTNGSRLSSARRNKYDMHGCVERAKLRSIPCHTAQDWDSTRSWIERNGLPVVVKPVASTGSDRVFVCRNLEQAKRAFDAINSARNSIVFIEDTVLVQELIGGTEYMVNTVSHSGHHYVTDFWRMGKPSGDRPLYDLSELLPSVGELQDRVFEYTFAVLDALGIRFGPAHTELKVDDDGPVLLEVASRLCGDRVQIPCDAALGFNQVDLSIDAYLAPEAFLARTAQPYAMLRHFNRIDFICSKQGILRALPRLEDVRASASFFQLGVYVRVGEPIERTRDFVSTPGYVDLIHEDPAVVTADCRRIRDWLADDFFVVSD